MAKALIKQTAISDVFVESEGDTQRITTHQNVDAILEDAAEQRAETSGQKYGEFRKVAVMPMSVVGQAMREGWLYDQNKVRQWVRDNPAFLTFERGF